MSSVGVEIRKVARPPVAPAVKTLRWETGRTGESPRMERVRL